MNTPCEDKRARARMARSNPPAEVPKKLDWKISEALLEWQRGRQPRPTVRARWLHFFPLRRSAEVSLKSARMES
jgi:hypothetical protein